MNFPTEKEYERVARLLKFYGVESEGQLILAMDEHISKLQESLRKYKPNQQVRSYVREG